MTEYDRWLDKGLDEYYEDEEPLDLEWDDEPTTYPEDDYANYDGWDDMQ